MSNQTIDTFQNLLVDTVVVVAVLFYIGLALAILYVMGWIIHEVYQALKNKRRSY